MEQEERIGISNGFNNTLFQYMNEFLHTPRYFVILKASGTRCDQHCDRGYTWDVTTILEHPPFPVTVSTIGSYQNAGSDSSVS